MTTAIRALAVAAAILALGGCGDVPPPEQGSSTTESVIITDVTTITVKRADGTPMECVVYRPNNGGGIDCNWSAR